MKKVNLQKVKKLQQQQQQQKNSYDEIALTYQARLVTKLKQKDADKLDVS